MKIAIMELIEHAPVALLKEYFANQSFAKEIDWNLGDEQICSLLVDAIGKMDKYSQEPLIHESERIHLLADELGQHALGSLLHENKEFRQMKNAYQRALWVFLHEYQNFKYAEELYYSETYLQDGTFDGFVGPKDINITQNKEGLLLFKQRVKEFFREAEKSDITIFHRYILNNIGQLVKVLQVMIYLQNSQPQLKFEGSGEEKIFVNKMTHQADNISITYEPNAGQVDIFYKGGESKKEIVKVFAQTLLQSPDGGKVTLRRYILEKFLKPHEFVTDPEDGIESVKVMVFALQPLVDKNIITIECSPEENRLIHEVAQEILNRTSLHDHFIVAQALIFIHLFSDRTATRDDILSVRITHPNGCEIKSKTTQERNLVEKCLQHWGIMEEF